MKPESMKALFSAMLDQQYVSRETRALSDERMRETLTTGPELTGKEKELLIRSPLARYCYQDMQSAIAEEITDALQQGNISTHILPLAAADHADTHSFSCTGYKVILYDKKKYGIPWVILLQLDKSFQEAINPLTVLRLVDSGGLEWMRGRPDANGELTASWTHADTDLLERAKQYSLNLEIV
ncbi:MAG TPA: hypothetical protein EYP34_14240 [Chromatiaceae bacterium]|nr:hypothetical protein [Chromatiaceae bacterium]